SVSTASFTVTNSAFGAWYNYNYYRTAIYVAGTLYEDYNHSWGDGQNLVWAVAGSSVTHGGHSAAVSNYIDIFTGNTSDDEWDVDEDLYTAASDGLTIGAWQAP